MLIRPVLIFLFCFVNLAVWSQELISDVQNMGSAYIVDSRGFVTYEDYEFLIERGEVETKVSILENGEINFLHSMPYRPKDGRTHFLNEHRYNNSGFVTNNELIYEVYDFDIYILNFVSGGLVKHIDLCEYDVSYSIGFTLLENKILFRGDHYGDRAYYVYDITDDNLEIIDWTVNASIFRADEWLYTWNEALDSVYGFNVLSGEMEYASEVKDGIWNLSIRHNLLEPRLKIVTNTNELIEVADGEEIYRCNCFTQEEGDISESYYRDGIIFVSIFENGYSRLMAKYVDTCDDFMSFEDLITETYFNFLDNKVLDARYLLVTDNENFFSAESHYMIDLQEKIIHSLELQADILLPYHSLVIDDILYIIGIDGEAFVGFRKICFAIDLNDKSSIEVPINSNSNIQNLIIGENRQDKKINFLTYEFGDDKSLWEYNSQDNTAIMKMEGLDFVNRGVRYYLRSLKVGDKQYYVDEMGVYVIEDSDVKKILDGNANMPLVENDGIISGLVSIDFQLYSFEINTVDDSWNTEILEGFDDIDLWSPATDHVIFVLNDLFNGKGYLDINTREFVNLKNISGNPVFNVLGVSDENAFIHYYPFNDEKYRIFNTDTKEYIDLNFLSEDYEDAIADGYGGFYLMEYGSGAVGNHKIVHVSGNGTLLNQMEVSFSNVYYEDYLLQDDGNLIFPLPGEDEVQILISKNNEPKIKSLPYEGTQYYRDIFIRNYKDKSLVGNVVDGMQRATYLSYDEDPVDLSNGGVSDNLIEVVFSDEKIALFYFEFEEDKLRIEIFDLATKELLSSDLHEISKFRYPTIEILGRLSNTVSLVAFDNGENGQEAFLFDIESGDFNLLEDMSPEGLDSNPAFFSRLGQYSYFTAFSEDRSRQWFRIRGSDFTTVDEEIVENSLNIFPNPAMEYISFDNKIKDYEITNAEGREVIPRTNGWIQRIDVSNLTAGLYTILGTNKSGKIMSGKFIIQR